MNANPMTRVVAKLNNLLGNHFGVALQYIPVTDQEARNAPALETVKRNAGAPLILAHNQLLIPMRVEGALVGATRVEKINSLQPRQLSQIKDTVDLILNEVLAAHSKLQQTKRTEELMFDTSNVIAFRNTPLAKSFETGS